MKNESALIDDKPSRDSEDSTRFRTPEDNAAIEMFAEQLAELLLDHVLSKRASRFKKSHRRR
jgi:hypothetical protein